MTISCIIIVGTYSTDLTGYQARINDILRYNRQATESDIDFDVVPLNIGSIDSSKEQIKYNVTEYRLTHYLKSIKHLIEQRPNSDIVHLTTVPWQVIPFAGIAIRKPVIFGPNIGGNPRPLEELNHQTLDILEETSPARLRKIRLYREVLTDKKIRMLDSGYLFPKRKFVDFSEWSRDTGLVTRDINPKFVEILPSGVCRDIFYANNNEKKLTKEALIVVTPSGIRLKGLALLVDAYNQYTDYFPVNQITVVGCERREAEKELSDDLPSKFEFKGRIDRVDMAEHYRRADVYVFPSYSEAEGTTMLEALSCGTPCIATDDRAFRSPARGSNTLFFERGNADELAKTFRQFYDSPNKHIESARKNSKCYDISKAHESLVKVYKSLIKK